MSTPAAERGERFPGFDTLQQADAWDDVTRSLLESRVNDIPPVTFFKRTEERAARALLDCLLALDARPGVPVLELIDARLAAGDGDGYRYDTMPEDGDAWRRSLAGLDADAGDRFGLTFAETTGDQRRTIVESIQGGDGTWHGMTADRVFGLWMRYACTAFYSHPSAWNEIGFGGPAYPRGYKNIGVGRREPWEVAEVDADDPVPWAERVEAAHRRHESAGDDASPS
jgi:hypothetical protein